MGADETYGYHRDEARAPDAQSCSHTSLPILSTIVRQCLLAMKATSVNSKVRQASTARAKRQRIFLAWLHGLAISHVSIAPKVLRVQSAHVDERKIALDSPGTQSQGSMRLTLSGTAAINVTWVSTSASTFHSRRVAKSHGNICVKNVLFPSVTLVSSARLASMELHIVIYGDTARKARQRRPAG